jgi:hypothetical protein
MQSGAINSNYLTDHRQKYISVLFFKILNVPQNIIYIDVVKDNYPRTITLGVVLDRTASDSSNEGKSLLKVKDIQQPMVVTRAVYRLWR